MNKEVNSELYDFLKENETGLFKDKGSIIAYIHINFSDLDKFVKIVGDYWFEEGGLEVLMFNNTICVELNDIIEGKNHYLSSYKNCFNEYDWQNYEEEILKLENNKN